MPRPYVPRQDAVVGQEGCEEPSEKDDVGFSTTQFQEVRMKGLVAWWLGVPVVVIVILYVIGVF
ncbi:hypothetical protein FIU66_10690 [Paracoccus sp. AK26]|nr:hypothetical protein FIU66_10690 [Paracoccus sp. AK26]